MMERETEALRREFLKFGRGRGQRYPSTLKERAIALARERRAAGATWVEIAASLGLHQETMRCWCNEASEPKTMRRVEIAADESDKTVSIVAPSGFRIEGLSLADALTSLEKLK
jgi:transposase-like protein